MAYRTTQVNWSRSQTQMMGLLQQHGIIQTRFTNMGDKFCLEFIANVPESSKPVAVRIVVPVQYSGENEKKAGQELNMLHRVLFYHLKAKFVAIENGLTEFTEEFMPHLVITDSKGNSTTMGEMLLPQYTQSLEEGKTTTMKFLPGA